MKVIVQSDRGAAGRALESWIKRRAEGHLESLAQTRAPGAKYLGEAELSILLTRDAKIRQINRKWRQKDKATDVLSFPQMSIGELRLAKAGAFLLGDIVISVDTALRQAPLYRHSFREELERLLVHGLLHLLGYDHEIGPKEELRMKRLEKKLLTR